MRAIELVDSQIAMRVILAQDFTDDTGGFLES